MNKTTTKNKQQKKAMALEFKKCFGFIFTFLFLFLFHFVLYYMKNCFLPAGTLHFRRLG